MDSPSQFIYPVTTGQSGTLYLTRLLAANIPRSEVHHEFAGFPHLGRRTPDASHLTTFNHVGNVPEVRSFWRRKFGEDMKSAAVVYAELSHVLAKAGQLENLDLLPPAARIDVILLQRDSFETYWGHLNRYDFLQPSFAWLCALDARYPNVIVPSAPYRKQGGIGHALWYVHEMTARAAYYGKLLAEDPRVRVHPARFEDLRTAYGAATLLQALGHRCDPAEVELPREGTPARMEVLGAADRERAKALHSEFACDAGQIGERFHGEGMRLGAPVHLFLQASSGMQHQPLPPPIGKKKIQDAARGPNLKSRGISGSPGDVGLSG